MCWKGGKSEVEADVLPPKPAGNRVGSAATAQSPTSTTATNAAISFQSCRRCSDQFTFVCDDGRRVHIIAGPPKALQSKVLSASARRQDAAYKAISYVWGETTKLPMYCTKCKSSFATEMQDAQKFHCIISLAKADEHIWLDAMSINQDDENDKKQQISQMGRLYGEACVVAVLLPKSDERAFELLASMAAKADVINQHQGAFTKNDDPLPGNQLSKCCQELYSLFEEFEQSLPAWTYFRRAWTFQEWAMAVTLDIGLEGNPAILHNVKFSILHAATLSALYKHKQGAFATIKFGFSRGELPRRFNQVKRLFPDELAFVSPDETIEDSFDHSFQNLFPSLGGGRVFGLRTANPTQSVPEALRKKPPIHEQFQLRALRPANSPAAFKGRLSMMLNAFATSTREARYEADRVCCWASMCNINYSYDKDDSYAVALQKVLAQIRFNSENNVRLFTFQANTNSLLNPVDLDFLEYASLHMQSNGRHDAEFTGTPLFSGRADTLRHVKICLRQPNTHVQLAGDPALVQRVDGLASVQAAQMNHIDKTLELWAPAITGWHDGMTVHDIVDQIGELLKDTPTQVLASKALTVVTINTTSIDTNEPRKCALWTIVPYDRTHDQIMVGREVVNGQLALIVRREDCCDIVGYLALTDQQSGTHLAWCQNEGKWATKLDVPQRADKVDSRLAFNDVWWAGKFALAQGIMSVR